MTDLPVEIGEVILKTWKFTENHQTTTPTGIKEAAESVSPEVVDTCLERVKTVFQEEQRWANLQGATVCIVT